MCCHLWWLWTLSFFKNLTTAKSPKVSSFDHFFQKGHSNIKVVFWYGDSRFQGFLVISSHFDRKFQVWNIFYLVTKSLIQLLIENAGGCWGETYIKWKAWMSSFWKKWSKLETFGDLAVVRFLKNDNVQSHQRWQHMI